MSDERIKLFKDILEESFDISKFANFAKEIFGSVQVFPSFLSAEKPSNDFKEYVESFSQVAKYNDGENNIIVLAVKLQKSKNLDRGRNIQRRFVSKIISNTNYEAALVAFYNEEQPNWRLSFVKLDYAITEGKAYEIKPVKRFSFIVGKGESCHTAINQLSQLKANPTVDNILHAFSVESITNDFFENYRKKYLKLKEDIQMFADEADKERFSKKLMGQILFLYFLQKKGWLGVKEGEQWGSGDKKYIPNQFNKCVREGKEFYNDFLKILFGTLNEDRRILFSKVLNCKVPFLMLLSSKIPCFLANKIP